MKMATSWGPRYRLGPVLMTLSHCHMLLSDSRIHTGFFGKAQLASEK